jgi:hypothetical protein
LAGGVSLPCWSRNFHPYRRFRPRRPSLPPLRPLRSRAHPHHLPRVAFAPRLRASSSLLFRSTTKDRFRSPPPEISVSRPISDMAVWDYQALEKRDPLCQSTTRAPSGLRCNEAVDPKPVSTDAQWGQVNVRQDAPSDHAEKTVQRHEQEPRRAFGSSLAATLRSPISVLSDRGRPLAQGRTRTAA